MLHINLLPEEEKNIIVFERWSRTITFFGIAVSAILIIGITLLIPAYLPLYFQNREFKRAFALNQQAAQKTNASTTSAVSAQLQTIITSLRNSEKNPSGALDLIYLLSAVRPGITITSFNVDAGGNLSLSGFAAARKNLLDFEQELRDSSRFQDIASPIGNIIQETSINFSFRATLKPAYAI